jgi:hypothetical protein
VLRLLGRLAASPSLRLRVGIVLWGVSWLPVAELVGATRSARLAIWGLQIIVGLVGIALAGSTFVGAVKGVGWRRAPGVLWRGLVHGDAGAPA